MSSTLLGDLRIVILKSPYDCWNDPVAVDLFQKTVRLKLEGYRGQYDYGVLPIDTTDFVSNHMIICRQGGSGELDPLLSFKRVTLDRCEIHRIPFPGRSLAAMAEGCDHVAAVEEIVSRCVRQRRRLSYEGAWTMAPEARQDRERARTLREIFEAMYELSRQEEEISESILGATLRFKTEKIFHSWGYKPLSLDGRELPSIRVSHLLNEPVQLVHQIESSPELREKAERYRFFWNRRLVITGDWLKSKDQRKAA